MVPSRHGLAHSQTRPIQPTDTIPSASQLIHSNEEGIGLELRTQPPLNIQDLCSIADDIKDTLSAAISELRLDLRALNDKVHNVESAMD